MREWQLSRNTGERAMTSFRLFLLTVSALSFTSGIAVADPAYRASDIVNHFSRKAGLGATRSLCIGTESECSKEIPERTKAVDSFDLRVQFEYNSATLTSLARANLDEFAKALSDPNLPAGSFLVEGHTDGFGSDAYNLDLSMRRAAAVVEYLTAKGVPTDRLLAKGFGKQRPIDRDPMSSANRRVETRLRTE